jgi:hypothetical protein
MGTMPIVSVNDDLYYPPFLWPSLVDNLYDIAEDLMEAFDWPYRDVSTWFILTDEALEIRLLDGKWVTKQGKYLNPQWRIQLTVSPWVHAEEVLRAYWALRRQTPKGRELSKKTTPLEVVRFVWEQERLHGDKDPIP